MVTALDGFLGQQPCVCMCLERLSLFLYCKGGAWLVWFVLSSLAFLTPPPGRKSSTIGFEQVLTFGRPYSTSDPHLDGVEE